MKKDEISNEDFTAYAKSRESGRDIDLPRWASLFVMATKVACMPTFWFPMSAAVVAYAFGKSSDPLHIAGFAAVAGLPILAVMTIITVQDMARDGVLMPYLSILMTDWPVGRVVVKLFGRPASTGDE